MSRRGRHSKGKHLRTASGSSKVRVAYSVLMCALVSFALAVVAIPLASEGEWRTIQTGSMEPLVSPGDVVLVTPPRAPEVGDVIAFTDPIRPERDVLHRVVDIDEEGMLITRGDANDVVDPWLLDPATVIGTQTITIPTIGFVIAAVGSDLGILLFLVIPALLIVISEGRIWYRYVRYGPEAFEPLGGRHMTPRGKHLAGAH